ncbi:hypothetical protein ACTI_18630 [Actinoplanes sp. OR16]|nr:hypothetical protein ACTI_18630 [Actinoplanes sp. OR16]
MEPAAACGTLRVAGFGALAEDQIASGRIEPDASVCYTLTAPAGWYQIRTSSDWEEWTLSAPGGAVVCRSGYGPVECLVPDAGDHTLSVRSEGIRYARSYAVTVVRLSGDDGCAPAVSTAWDQAAVTFPQESGLELFCQPFTARPGERVIAFEDGGEWGWITDTTGARICSDPGGLDDGCVLPGSGPYRFLMGSVGVAREARAQVRSLSDPVGCPTLSPALYDTVPVAVVSEIRCRALTVTAGGPYLIRLPDGESWRIFDPAGARVCASGEQCRFPVAGSYTLVIGGSSVVARDFTTTFASLQAAGCAALGDQGLGGEPYRGSLGAVGEVDCLRLPGPSDALMLLSTTGGAVHPSRFVVNGSGEVICGRSECTLSGPAPYRVLLTASTSEGVGDYALRAQRLDLGAGCSALAQGVSTTATFAGDRKVLCYAIPAGKHAAVEAFTFARQTGESLAALHIRDTTGKVVCGAAYTSAASMRINDLLRCRMDVAKAYTALITTNKTGSAFRVTRRDAVPPEASCRIVTPTVVGGPATTGTFTARDDRHCLRFSTAASSIHWIDVRGAALRVIDSAGKTSSCQVGPCRLTGSTGYRLVLTPLSYGTLNHVVNVWNLGSAGRPPAQCPLQRTSAPGAFGPITGTLGAGRTAVCVALPMDQSRHSFKTWMTNTAGGEELPELHLFQPDAEGTSVEDCGSSSNGRVCTVYTTTGSPAIFLITRGSVTGDLPFKVETLCDPGPCETGPYEVSAVLPYEDLMNDQPRAVGLIGNSFDLSDRVTLVRAGQPSIPGTVRYLRNDRTELSLRFDITGAAPGYWDVVTVSSFKNSGGRYSREILIHPTYLKLTKAPAISGSARVGATVKVVNGSWSPAATGYSYQWFGNGVAIKGATGSSYKIPASMRGKRLTVTVTAKRAHRANSPAVSAGVTVGWGVAPVAKTKPSISGTVKNGKTVTAKVGAWAPAATSYKYVWKLNGKVVGNSSKLKLKKSWKGKKLTLTVIAKRTGHLDGVATSKASKIK